MGAEYKFGTGGHLIDGLDEAHAALGEVANNMQVVDNLVEHIERRPMPLERAFHGFNGHLHAGTEAARLGDDDFFYRHRTTSSLEESLNSVNPELISIRNRYFRKPRPKKWLGWG